MPQITVEGCRFNYRFDGPERAPLVVFSNSLSSNLSMWDPQVAAFRDEFRILRYDRRGHGGTEVTPAPYGMEQLGRDTAGLLEALDVQDAAFCGLSLGGMVGMWLGTNAPQRLRKLVLCNTAAYMGPKSLWDGRIQSANEAGMESLWESTAARWFTPAFRERDPAAVEAVRQGFVSTPPTGYAGCCAAIRDMDQRESIAAIGLPTMVIMGEHDPSTPPEAGGHIVGKIRDAVPVVLPAAHLSNVEAAGEFNVALREFLLTA